MNIARWLIAYGICALIGGAALACFGQFLELGSDAEASGVLRFSASHATENFNAAKALIDTLIMTPIMALFGFVPALVIFGVPEAIGIRPSGMRNALIAALFVGAPFLYLFWDMGGGSFEDLLTDGLFLPVTVASMLGALTLGLLRQGPLCYRKPE